MNKTKEGEERVRKRCIVILLLLEEASMRSLFCFLYFLFFF